MAQEGKTGNFLVLLCLKQRLAADDDEEDTNV